MLIDLPFSTHSLGGMIAFKILSLPGLFSSGGRVLFLPIHKFKNRTVKNAVSNFLCLTYFQKTL